jgi:hypothetical protein
VDCSLPPFLLLCSISGALGRWFVVYWSCWFRRRFPFVFLCMGSQILFVFGSTQLLLLVWFWIFVFRFSLRVMALSSFLC